MNSRYCGLLCGAGMLIAATVNAAEQPFRVGVVSAIHKPEQTYAAQLIDMALAQHGYQFELISLPGKRLMSKLNQAEVDGDLIRSVDLSRGFDSVVRVDEALGSTCGSVYRLSDRTNLDLESAMHEVSVAVYHGAPGASSFFFRLWPAVNLEFFGSLPQGLKMLAHERIDLIAVHDLDQNYLESLSARPLQRYARFNLEPNYFHVNIKHAALAKSLEATLKALKLEFPPPSCFEAGRELSPGALIYSSSEPSPAENEDDS